MVVLCNANAIIGNDRRRSGLPSAPLDVEYDNSIDKKYENIMNHIHVLGCPDGWRPEASTVGWPEGFIEG